jgi:tetratricopeptide (TPR) repeat protein
MSSVAAKSEFLRPWLPPLVLALAVMSLRPLEFRLSARDARGRTPAGGLAALGGLRAAAAGGCWLRANLAWERRDAATTRVLLDMTVAADARPLYFWLNGARMIAYDMAQWRGEGGVPAGVRDRIIREQANEALAWLERARPEHGAKSDLYLEMANIRLRALDDREGAAQLFRLAAEQPDAPWHAARIYGELLRGLGRPEAALTWLRQILPGLPADEPGAQREVVLQRMAELEREIQER